MNAYAAAVLASGLILATAGASRAESEGNGDPFPHQAGALSVAGPAFLSDTGQEAYPQPSGNRGQPSTLATLEPAFVQAMWVCAGLRALGGLAAAALIRNPAPTATVNPPAQPHMYAAATTAR